MVLHLCAKNLKNLTIISRENPKKTHFGANGPNLPKIVFFEYRLTSHSRVYGSPSLCKKSEKTNDPIVKKLVICLFLTQSVYKKHHRPNTLLVSYRKNAYIKNPTLSNEVLKHLYFINRKK